MKIRTFALVVTSVVALSSAGVARAQAHDHQAGAVQEQAQPQTPSEHDHGTPAPQGASSMACCGKMMSKTPGQPTAKAEEPPAAEHQDHNAAATGSEAPADVAKTNGAMGCCASMGNHAASQSAKDSPAAGHTCCCSGMKM